MSNRQLIADLLSALEYHTEQTRPIEFSRVAIQAATEYLREPEQPAQQEQKTCLVANESCKHGSWCSEVYCQEHCKFVEQPTPVPEAHEQEPFGYVTVRRLSQRFENHVDQYHFYPAGQSPYLDNVDELHAVYTRPQAREPLTDEEIMTYRHMIDWTAEWSYINFARAIEAAHGIEE